MSRSYFVAIFTFLAWGGILAPAIAKPHVDIEVATTGNFAGAAIHRWSKMLSEVGFDNVRIRGGRADDEPQITQIGTEKNPSFKVVGVLGSDDKLVLKGGKFGIGDRTKLQQYLEKLGEVAGSGTGAKRGAFGLSDQQLIGVLTELEAALPFSTKDVPPRLALRKIEGLLKSELVVTAEAEQALREADPCSDELEGVSAGTALAAIVRPSGLVLLPRSKGAAGKIELAVIPSAANQESWPIGWPSEKQPRELLPVMFEFLNVEIDGIAFPEAIAAIQSRLKAPLLYDYNSIAAQQIDLEKVEVKHPSRRTFYKKVLDQVLFQAHLKGELRVDEAGKPLFWITTLRN